MSGPGSVILVCVSMVLAVGAVIAAWESARYAKQSRERAAASYAEIKRLQDRDNDAVEVIHEWQRDGESNDYLTRVHRALRPPVSGEGQGPKT